LLDPQNQQSLSSQQAVITKHVNNIYRNQ